MGEGDWGTGDTGGNACDAEEKGEDGMRTHEAVPALIEIAENALRAVRGEGISDETHRESVSASNKSHPD